MVRPHSPTLFARARRRTDDRLTKRFSTSDDAVFVLRGSEVGSVSSSVRELLGWEPELCVGRTLSELFGRETYVVLDELQTMAEQAGGHLATRRGMSVEHEDGNLVWLDATINDMRDDSNVNGTVLTIHDVTSRVEMEQRIRDIEHHDPLTSTANATMFEVIFNRALDQGDPVGIIVVATPGVRQINSDHGTDFGDGFLIEVSRRLASVLRAGDHVARVTNAQFAMIVNHLDSADPRADLDEVCERVTAALGDPFTVNDKSVHVATTIRADFCSNESAAPSLADSQPTGCRSLLSDLLTREGVSTGR
jgi:PAS domain S-box-containing protein